MIEENEMMMDSLVLTHSRKWVEQGRSALCNSSFPTVYNCQTSKSFDNGLLIH
ncbi:MAG: hypothetical protein MJZ33_04740 [Paludibacteraceae bacterium]|nr:hypothetical protein [Paludibacteraceae bacterium]